MNRLFLSILRKEVWRIHRLANRLLIVITNLDGFSLANHGLFAKIAKLSRYIVVDNILKDHLLCQEFTTM